MTDYSVEALKTHIQSIVDVGKLEEMGTKSLRFVESALQSFSCVGVKYDGIYHYFIVMVWRFKLFAVASKKTSQPNNVCILCVL